jgi:5-formyltetrahydrofolate cyclo-ligase
MNKNELRALYKQKRAEIAPNEKLLLDDLLLIKFQQLYFSQVAVLLTYWPSAKHGEPNTHLFSGYLIHMIPGLETAYPVINNKTGTFDAVLSTEDTVYSTNTYGIKEPLFGEIIPPTSIDLVFVPLLICDKFGNRVGYGKGFYDKYLATCRDDVIKVGFNYFAPADKIDDTHLFDIPLNYLVTTDNIYEF